MDHRRMNFTGVTFTPNGGSPIAVQGVTGPVEFDEHELRALKEFPEHREWIMEFVRVRLAEVERIRRRVEGTENNGAKL